MLSQASEDTVEQLENAMAVKKIISDTSINYWNVEFVDQMISLITETVHSVPILHLACTPTVNAVNVLFEHLYHIEEVIQN